MDRYASVLTALLLVMLCSCSPKHLINDKMFRDSVFSDYSRREKSFGKHSPDLFSKINLEKDPLKKEALSYLAAYMPLNDFADFPYPTLSGAVEVALRSRTEMPWGKNIPENVFLSFVLPPRVNNENLDSFRIKYYREIYERVKGMDEAQAALEINHWCHEKVAYQPSDSRTSSPLATILSARGRCGEESTFTVSALRTAGIPTRQVYTPRWAHTDDNHAWVEVWVNGSWHYMGACEPEPVLDRGWFTEPARRAMLIHTKAFGRYNSDEIKVKSDRYFSEINCLPEYAITKELKVTVDNTRGEIVKNASVEFLLYNYAELYPLASVETDENGKCHFVTGMGDLVVWAHSGNEFGFSHVSVAETDSVNITIAETQLSGEIAFDLKAPVARTPFPGPDPELVKKNSLRVSNEDSIRHSYVKSWKSEESIKEILEKVNLNEPDVRDIITRSMGNYASITRFLVTSGEKAQLAMQMLKNVSEKDLRDADSEILTDHLKKAPEQEKGLENDIYERYLLSPRVDNEKLSPWRTLLPEIISSDLMSRFSKNPEEITGWIDSVMVITAEENYYNVPLTPGAVAKLRLTDIHSEKIFYVALCRTLGIPSRIDPGTDRPQYFRDNKWNDAWLSGEKRSLQEKSFVSFMTKNVAPSPEYYSHFTLARFENGRYRTLEFDFSGRISSMPHDIPVDPGRYMLFTGNRISDVTVLADAFFFDLRPGEHKTLNVSLRHSVEPYEKTGEISYSGDISTVDGKTLSFKDISESGLVGIWIVPGSEPTNHILNDLPVYKDEFDKWGGHFVFFVDMSAGMPAFDALKIKGLPDKTIFAKDSDLKILKSIFPQFTTRSAQMPVIFYADKNGNIYYFSEGYKIGAGDQILKRIK
jgi:transglutaminase-like putative cysteine protease